MTINNESLLTINSHSGDSNTETVTGEKVKGDGYYGRSDGLHTVQYDYVDFTGQINLQATLEIDPQESDWFTVHTENVEQDTADGIVNITGNYVWIRAQVVYTDGTVNSITMTH
jgi:hypothetical protein